MIKDLDLEIKLETETKISKRFNNNAAEPSKQNQEIQEELK